MKLRFICILIVISFTVYSGQASLPMNELNLDQQASSLTDAPVDISEIDNDGNGLINIFLIEIEVDVKEFWVFEIDINFLDNNKVSNYYSLYAEFFEKEVSSLGIQNFSIEIDAENLFNTYFKGDLKIHIHVDIRDPSSSNLYQIGEKYGFTSFDYEDMERSSFYIFQSSFTITYLDADSGKNITEFDCNCVDLIILNVSVYQEIAEFVGIMGKIEFRGIDNFETRYQISRTSDEIPIGKSMLEIVFDAHGLNNTVGLLPLYFHLDLSYFSNNFPNSYVISDFIAYREVNASIFEDKLFDIQYIKLTNMDKNENGEIDGLSLNLELIVNKDINISLYANLIFKTVDGSINIDIDLSDTLFVQGVKQIYWEVETKKLYNLNSTNSFDIILRGSFEYETFPLHYNYYWYDLNISHPVYENPSMNVDTSTADEETSINTSVSPISFLTGPLVYSALLSTPTILSIKRRKSIPNRFILEKLC